MRAYDIYLEGQSSKMSQLVHLFKDFCKNQGRYVSNLCVCFHNKRNKQIGNNDTNKSNRVPSLAFFGGKTFGQFSVFFGMNGIFEVDIRLRIFVQNDDWIS